MRRADLCVVVAAWLTAVGSAAAQAPAGRITGTVTAANGGDLAGVTVVARSRRTGASRQTVSGADGAYVIDSLPADDIYDLQAQVAGFVPVVRESVAVKAEATVRVDFVMRGAVAETIAVTAPTPELPPDRTTIQQAVSERLVHTLPLIGRDFLDLASLTAGFSGNPSYPSPQGQIFWSNNVLVDGGSHFSKWRSAARTFYSGYGLESIKELRVLTSQFSAEFGEALATVTTVITNSGTDDLRGTALLFAQDDALNDVPAFASVKPPFSSQRFGLTLGGPIVRQQTHFFGSYEGWRSRGHNIVVSPAAPEAQVPSDEDQHLMFVRADHHAGDRQLLTGRYNGQWFQWHDEIGGLSLPGTGTRSTNDVHTFQFADAIAVSNRLVSQFRGQFARFADVRSDLQPTVFVSRAGYSIEGGALGPWGFGADPEDTWEATGTSTLSLIAHSLKFGGGFKHVRARNTSLPYGRGAYYFAGPPAFYPQPYAFAQSLATQEVATADPRSFGAHVFLQDDWRLGPRLTVNIGARYDIEDVTNIRGYDAPSDKNNLQPRLGAAWDPTGAGTTVVRGGVGLYTQQHLLYPINRIQLEGPDGTVALWLAPGSPLMPVFPNALPPSLPILPPRDIQVVHAQFANPYSFQAAAGIERTLFETLLAADYIYLHGRSLMSLIDLNAPASIQKPERRTVAEADATRPLVPAPDGYRKILELGNQGESWYHALQVKANRTTGRLRAMASYTWARARDRANYLLPEDSRNLAAEEGFADNDIRQMLAAGVTWDSPGEGAVSRGWTIAGLGQFRGGRPYTISWGDDRNGTTQNDARPDGRNTARGDAYSALDLAISKRFSHSKGDVEIRAEAFNLFSVTNHDEYVGVLSSPAFGQPVSAFPRRRMQLAAIARF
jgi:hypothetical protein